MALPNQLKAIFDMPRTKVRCVCEVPFGSYPGNMPYEYFSDEDHLCEWLTAEADVDTHREFLDRLLFGVRDFAEYLELCGGSARLELRPRQMSPVRP